MVQPKETLMNSYTCKLTALALSSALACLPVLAANGEMPPPQSYGAVTVVNGGADLDEAELFKKAAPQYPLRVVFSVRGGDYAVADQFTILHNGTVIAEIPSAGPWLLVNLPPGNYTLRARFEGQVSERPVSVGRASTARTVQWVAPSSID
jgi:hypothetical protein